jgi:hypothetical protein
MKHCPTCGQPLLTRHGVRLPLKKAELLDVIEARRGGINLSALAAVFYPGVPAPAAHARIKNHICQINDLLVATNYRVANNGGLYQFWELNNGGK